jgi:hypothetical protein
LQLMMNSNTAGWGPLKAQDLLLVLERLGVKMEFALGEFCWRGEIGDTVLRRLIPQSCRSRLLGLLAWVGGRIRWLLISDISVGARGSIEKSLIATSWSATLELGMELVVHIGESTRLVALRPLAWIVMTIVCLLVSSRLFLNDLGIRGSDEVIHSYVPTATVLIDIAWMLGTTSTLILSFHLKIDSHRNCRMVIQ